MTNSLHSPSPLSRQTLKTPDISVIVPVYNHWHLIPSLFEHLARQSLGQDHFEILLIDNGSKSISKEYKLPPNAAILECSQPGSYAARNVGITQASGGIFAFTDADCRPSPQWLSRALEAFEQFPKERPILAGAVQIIPADATRPNPYELFDMLLGIPQERYATLGFGATANLIVPREIFQRAGPFDATRYSGGDAEFCLRATASGARVVYHADILVQHPARHSWPEISAKARRIKGGQLCTGTPRQRIVWAVKTLLPPVVSWQKVMTTRGLTLGQRLAVCVIHARLWIFGIGESFLLLTRIKKPAR